MRYRWSSVLPAAVFVFLCVFAVPREGYTAQRMSSVRGVVQRVQGNEVSIAGKKFDLKGVPVWSTEERKRVDTSTLAGKTVEIQFRNGKPKSATVFRSAVQ